jgi:uncharacterized DUF497 family protein
MDIVWDEEKNAWLAVNRAITFEEIADLILAGEYLAILEHPSRENQQYFLFSIRGYTWVVPFLLDGEDRLVLKTAFPSRRFHKKYGGTDEASEAE